MIVITLARKPMAGTIVDTVTEYGTGGLNINACRISLEAWDSQKMERVNSIGSGRMLEREIRLQTSPIGTFARSIGSGKMDTTVGRWPANLILTPVSVAELDHLVGLRSRGAVDCVRKGGHTNCYGAQDVKHVKIEAEIGYVSRFFKQVEQK